MGGMLTKYVRTIAVLISLILFGASGYAKMMSNPREYGDFIFLLIGGIPFGLIALLIAFLVDINGRD